MNPEILLRLGAQFRRDSEALEQIYRNKTYNSLEEQLRDEEEHRRRYQRLWLDYQQALRDADNPNEE